MVVSAEKARQKAEARRQRILAKSAERMDVVNGLAPSDDMGDDAADIAAANNGVTNNGVMNNGVDEVSNSVVENESVAVENDTISNSGSASSSSKGARRMAAMRRRRYQAKKKEEKSSTTASTNDDEKENNTDDAVIVEEVNDAEKESTEPPLVEDDTCTTETKEQPSASTSSSTTSTEPTKKKYMGVARMRRKINKEQKAQRIAELESASSNTIDAAATMATIDMTASMIREGSVSVGEGDLSDVAIQSIRGKRKWWRVLFPPMALVPRLVTLVLLFMAGLDVGLEPHRKSSAAASLGNGGESLIYHVESSFTKPWEYGMGGKARHLMGMMESAPPTSMPTSFTREGFCVSVDEDCDELSDGKEKERDVKAKLLSSNDEFGSSEQVGSRPKGVATSEFDDDEEGTETYSPPVIDPIFRVDLDTLLQNSQLPAPINFAAKFAIGFHRMWVYYLWTMPTSVLKSIFFSPKTLLSSWTANPPIFLFISLIIRLIGKILVGSAPTKIDDDGADGKKADNLDILGKLKDTALNYATSSFPKTILVLKTLKEIVSVDMYVILCGLLVGLVSPLVKDDIGLGMSGKVLGDGEL